MAFLGSLIKRVGETWLRRTSLERPLVMHIIWSDIKHTTWNWSSSWPVRIAHCPAYQRRRRRHHHHHKRDNVTVFHEIFITVCDSDTHHIARGLSCDSRTMMCVSHSSLDRIVGIQHMPFYDNNVCRRNNHCPRRVCTIYSLWLSAEMPFGGHANLRSTISNLDITNAFAQLICIRMRFGAAKGGAG